MTTTDDIARRVEEADFARSAKRTKAAQLVGELLHERTAVSLRLADIDQQLGDAIVENSDVIDDDELAKLTGAVAVGLTQILNARKQSRGRRKRRVAVARPVPRAGSISTTQVSTPTSCARKPGWGSTPRCLARSPC